MSKTNVLQLVQELALQQADSVIIDTYYDDAVNDLQQRDFSTSVELLTSAKDQETYTLSEDSGRLLSVFYDDNQLYRTSISSILSQDINWRDQKGVPQAFTFDEQAVKTFRLYPKPQESGKDFIFAFGQPFGVDYPEYAVAVVVTKVKRDVQDYLDLLLALMILSREFSRESDHRDFEFARACQQFADVILGFI